MVAEVLLFTLICFIFYCTLIEVNAVPGAEDIVLSKVDTSYLYKHTVVGSPYFCGFLIAFICISDFVL